MSERWFPNSMPPPMVDHYTLPWWQGAAEHRLLVQHCAACRHCQLPPAPLCSECAGQDLALVELNGRGQVYTFTTVHRPVAMDQPLPFIIAVIALDLQGVDTPAGVRMMSNLVEVEPAEVYVGMPVQVAWETMSEEVSVPRFRPLAGAGGGVTKAPKER